MKRRVGLHGLVNAASVVLILVGATLLVRSLPLQAALLRLEEGAKGLGGLGLVAYGLGYTVAALLFVPGSALTLAAGAIFGLLPGLAVVSAASTMAAALAFQAARHLLRPRVLALARAYPRFHAVDRAIARGGWKVVALLRLSPAMPFSAGNYLFGLTAVGFWPYVAASWAAMLPGTFLYVYLGHAGRVAAAGPGRTPAEWVLLGTGLAATVAVTGYVTRLARRGMETQAVYGGEPRPVEAESSAPVAPGAWSSLAALRLPLAGATALGLGLWVQANAGQVRYLLGPPPVSAAEAYAAATGGESFEHSRFDALLRAHVDRDGFVDYAGLAREQASLDAYLASLATARFEELGRDQKLALLIDAYNAFTLRLVLDHRPLASIKDIPAHKRWDDRRFRLAGETLSLDQIEQERIRPKFREPRVHFALVCAARGCPPLRAEAYTGERLEAQLADQAHRIHSDGRWVRFDPASGTLHLTKLYDWYGSDFLQSAPSIEEYVARQEPSVRAALGAGVGVRIRWLPYDWSLNEKR